MSRLELDQITLDRDSYAAVRADARKRMLAIRRSRRVQLGQLIALEFENEDTLHYQVQEMVYAENITTEIGRGRGDRDVPAAPADPEVGVGHALPRVR